MSQRDRIYAALQRNPEVGVCSSTFLEMRIQRFGARIAELRKTGIEITRVPCNDPYHRHTSTQWRYVLGPDRLF